MSASAAAPRVLVVSIQKAGTHLIAQLMQALGYRVEGLVNIGDWETRTPVPIYPAAIDDQGALAFELLCWLDRLGGNVRSRFSAAWQRAIEHTGDPVRRALERFSALPENLCLITHDLRLPHADGGFLREWSRTGRPPIIFTYRDPRDVLVSFVSYLTGRTSKKKHGGFTEYYLYEQILANLPDDDARLMHAIIDENFPGHDEFGQHLWLLRH